MNKPIDFDELSIRILNGLDEPYKHLSSAIQARETPIEFEELLENLLHVGAQLKLPAPPSPMQPAMAFAALVQSAATRSTNNGNRPPQHRPQNRSHPSSGSQQNQSPPSSSLGAHDRLHRVPLLVMAIRVSVKFVAQSATLLANVVFCLLTHGTIFHHYIVVLLE